MDIIPIKTEKALIQKLAPAALIILMIAAAVVIYFKFFKSASGTNSASSNAETGIVVDVDFIKSAAFKSLNYVPDSSVFEEVKGTINVPAGRQDPFAP